MDLYYKHSGRFTPFGALVGLIGGLAASVPLGWLYSYGIIQVSYIKLRAISTIFFGLGVGASAGFAMFWGKVRSRPVAVAIGLLSACFALYVSWGFWLHQVFALGNYNLDTLAVMRHPQWMWSIMQRVREVGTWGSRSDSMTKGTELTVIWSVEALTVLVCALGAAVAVISRTPFCENCDAWCKQSEKLVFFPSVFGSDLKQRLEAKDFSFIDKLVPTSEKFAHLKFELHSCATCNMLNTISVTQVLVQPAKSKWSQAKVDRKQLVNMLLITPDEAALLRRVAMGILKSPATTAAASTAAGV
ncbi:MAG: hypothetical protein ACJ71N_02395 [Terriglobales bacterium]